MGFAVWYDFRGTEYRSSTSREKNYRDIASLLCSRYTWIKRLSSRLLK